MTNREAVEYGGHGVNIGLLTDRNTPKVWWSKDYNSYVVALDGRGEWMMENGTRVNLLSINGIGEIRWGVAHWGMGMNRRFNDEERGAIEYFGLQPANID